MRKLVFAVMAVAVTMVFANKRDDTEKQLIAEGGNSVGYLQEKDAFPYPEIPSVLVRPEDRKKFLLEHYWDNYDFSDTVLVNNRNITEQGLVNQLALLAEEGTPADWIAESIGNLCSAMEKQPYARNVFMQLLDDYLYDPNSPLRNETLYVVYLERMMQSSVLDKPRKDNLEFKWKLVCRNRPGEKATDFTYYLPDGKRNTLLQTPVRGKHLLLLFYDPECSTCHDVLLQMINDRALSDAVAAGTVTVLAIYTEGDDTVWRKALSDMPKKWIVGSDRFIIKENLYYDLKAMPSLYLLDEKKQVILKDVPYSQVREQLLLIGK